MVNLFQESVTYPEVSICLSVLLTVLPDHMSWSVECSVGLDLEIDYPE
jgi:hypothetical protein